MFYFPSAALPLQIIIRPQMGWWKIYRPLKRLCVDWYARLSFQIL